MNSQYFEGILQLRNPTKRLIRFVRDRIANEPGIWVSKEVRHKNGLDLYLSSQKYLQKLGKLCQQSFGGELKLSRSLFSRDRQTSKDIYRVIVLFRLPLFGKGNVIEVRGEKYKVLSVGTKVMAKSLSTGKKKLFSHKSLQRVSLVDKDDLVSPDDE